MDYLHLFPEDISVAVAAPLANLSELPFRREFLATGLLRRGETGKIAVADLQRVLGRLITPEQFLAAMRKGDRKRRWQRAANRRAAA